MSIFPQQGLSKLHNANTIFEIKFHNLTFLDNHVHCSREILSQAQQYIENTQYSIKQTKTTRHGILVCCLFLQQTFKFPSFHPRDSKILQVFVILELCNDFKTIFKGHIVSMVP